MATAGGGSNVCDVFLSHAGQQKQAFVDCLHTILTSMEPGINTFLDEHSLEPGTSESWKEIETAARSCHIAVVVLSHEFICKHFPMMELELFLARQKTESKDKFVIMPVLYGLAFEEFSDTAKLHHKDNWPAGVEVVEDQQVLQGWAVLVKQLLRTTCIRADQTNGYEGKLARRVADEVVKRLKEMRGLPTGFSHEMVPSAPGVCYPLLSPSFLPRHLLSGWHRRGISTGPVDNLLFSYQHEIVQAQVRGFDCQLASTIADAVVNRLKDLRGLPAGFNHDNKAQWERVPGLQTTRQRIVGREVEVQQVLEGCTSNVVDSVVQSIAGNQHAAGVAMYSFNNCVAQSIGAASIDPTATKAERNRSSKKCSRERQKEKLSTLQEQYDKMTEELERLTVENQRLHQGARVLDKLLEASENQFPSSDQQFRARTRYSDELEEMKNLSPEMFIFKWKEYLKQASGLLLNCEVGSGNDDSLDHISLLTCNVAWMCKRVCYWNMSTMNIVYLLNLENVAPAAADDSHWLGVVKLLNFSEQQLAELRVVLARYQNGMQKITAERQRILSEDALIGKPEQSMYAWNDASRTDEVVCEKLATNLRRQHTLVLVFQSFFFGCFLTLQQFARAAVYSYPYFPDAFAIMAVAVHGTSSVPESVLPATATATATATASAGPKP